MKTIFDILYLIDHIRNNVNHNNSGRFSTVLYNKGRFFELKSSPDSVVLQTDNNYYDERVFSCTYNNISSYYDGIVGYPSYTHCKEWYINPVHRQFIEFENETYDLKKILSLDEFNVQLMYPSEILRQQQFSTELLKRNDSFI